MRVAHLGINTECQLQSVTLRLDLEPGPALDVLRSEGNVKSAQDGPFDIRITISKARKQFEHVIRSPIPVDHSNAAIRIARKSAYIEICLRTNVLAEGDAQDALLTAFPRHLRNLVNVPSLNPDIQPTLELKQDLQWMVTHVTSQISHAERKTRERYAHSNIECPSTRVDLKDSIFSLSMHYTGLQGKRKSIFPLCFIHSFPSTQTTCHIPSLYASHEKRRLLF